MVGGGSVPPQVASPLCAGTLIAFQAALTVLNWAQVGSRALAAVSVAVRTLAYRQVEVFDCMAL